MTTKIRDVFTWTPAAFITAIRQKRTPGSMEMMNLTLSPEQTQISETYTKYCDAMAKLWELPCGSAEQTALWQQMLGWLQEIIKSAPVLHEVLQRCIVLAGSYGSIVGLGALNKHLPDEKMCKWVIQQYKDMNLSQSSVDTILAITPNITVLAPQPFVVPTVAAAAVTTTGTTPISVIAPTTVVDDDHKRKKSHHKAKPTTTSTSATPSAAVIASETIAKAATEAASAVATVPPTKPAVAIPAVAAAASSSSTLTAPTGGGSGSGKSRKPRGGSVKYAVHFDNDVPKLETSLDEEEKDEEDDEDEEEETKKKNKKSDKKHKKTTTTSTKPPPKKKPTKVSIVESGGSSGWNIITTKPVVEDVVAIATTGVEKKTEKSLFETSAIEEMSESEAEGEQQHK
jgi:hypothetical protein